ncbi:MAG: hypothetical protein R2724_19190 [Bryobacterales bacterium]
MMKTRLHIAAALLFACAWTLPAQVKLLEGARVIDGTGRAPIEDAAVLINGNHITAVGRRGEIQAPAGAERLDFSGKTLVPGYIDHHFHIADDPTMVPLFLAGGVTFARDPGAWMELFAPVHAWKKANGIAGPRLSLCGPHLDGPNPAYPTDSVVILSPEEARRWVRGQIQAGATAIKVYFRLPLESVRATAEEAHRYGVPVTSHLEILDARAAVEAGVDGVEHITSLGIALVPPMEAERYRQAVYKDNNARRDGRYEVWAQVDPHGERAQALAEFLARRGTFVDPNFAVFERREKPGDAKSALKPRPGKICATTSGAAPGGRSDRRRLTLRGPLRRARTRLPPRARNVGRGRPDADGSFDCRRPNRRTLSCAAPTSAKSRRASSPTSSCSTPIRSTTSRTPRASTAWSWTARSSIRRRSRR